MSAVVVNYHTQNYYEGTRVTANLTSMYNQSVCTSTVAASLIWVWFLKSGGMAKLHPFWKPAERYYLE